jgi:hypothetical protein
MGLGEIVELNKLLASLLVVDSTIALSKISAPKENDSQRETIELVREFLQLNPELQRGCLKYAERMRKGYQDSGRKKSI